MTRQTFFEHAVFECDLGDDFFEFSILGPQILDFVASGFADSVACELLLTRFQEILAPALVEVGGNALAAAQFGNTLLTSQPFEDNPNLLLRRELPPGLAADLSYCRFCGLFLRSSHLETLPEASGPVKCLLAQSP